MYSEGVDDLGELLAHLQPGLFRCSDVGACGWCDQLFQALDLLPAPEFAVPVLFGAGWGITRVLFGTLFNPWVWPLLRPLMSDGIPGTRSYVGRFRTSIGWGPVPNLHDSGRNPGEVFSGECRSAQRLARILLVLSVICLSGA
jgi:hypothetical protein